MQMDQLIRTALGADYAHEHSDPGIRLGTSPVMLSAAKHLAAHRDRPFAELRACPEQSEWGDNVGADLSCTPPMYRPSRWISRYPD